MKTYTEEQLKHALQLQKFECYQKCGDLLISETPNINGALDYLSDFEGTLSIETIDEDLKAF